MKAFLLLVIFSLIGQISSADYHRDRGGYPNRGGYQNRGYAWAYGTDGNAHCYPTDNNSNIAPGVYPVDQSYCAGAGWGRVLEPARPVYACVGTNAFGAYAAGGGCNAFGCYYPGGNCNAFGCFYSGGQCNAFGCTNEAPKTDRACQ